MSLLAILDAIRASGQAEVCEIEDTARRQIHEMRATARLEGERIAAESSSSAAAPAVRERARILQRARLEALQIAGNKREGLVDAALDQARGHLEGLRTDAAYPAVLERLTREALGELERSREDLSSAQLEVDPRDRELMEGILHALGLNLGASYSLNCWGGLIVKSQDGRVVVINTLEARLERATPYLRRYLARLFESEHQESKLSQVVDLATAS